MLVELQQARERLGLGVRRLDVGDMEPGCTTLRDCLNDPAQLAQLTHPGLCQSYLVATPRWRLSRLMPHSTA